jgi:predicted DNA-binding transcriptional regulator YafY
VAAILSGAIQPHETWFGSLPPAAVVPDLVRRVEPRTLQAILVAIERSEALEVNYQSLTKTEVRLIAPHSLAFDGQRWHARCWCEKNKDFRDFVLTRILSLGTSRLSTSSPSDDMEWISRVTLKISAHPDLNAAQRAAIEHDYGMTDGCLRVETRVAFAFYLIKRFNLDITTDVIGPERKQIYLMNPDDIAGAVETSKRETQRRVAERTAMELRHG